MSISQLKAMHKIAHEMCDASLESVSFEGNDVIVLLKKEESPVWKFRILPNGKLVEIL